MKRLYLITCAITCIFIGTVCHAVELNCCGGYSGTHDASCTTHLTTIGTAGSSISGCCKQTEISSTSNGIASTYTCSQQTTKSGSIVSTKCVCGTKTYKCADGFYGTPNSTGTSGCTKCPANATCTDGKITCDKSYYLDGTSCKECPKPGITGGAGATSITACFIYHIDETATTTRWYDETGYFNVTEHCYYSTTSTPAHQILGVGTPK